MLEGLGKLPSYDEPADTDLLIRQSTIESMMLCPAKVGYTSHPDYDSTPSEAMVFGTVVHDLIEDHLRNDAPLYLNQPSHATEVFYKVAERDGFDLDEVATERTISESSVEAVLAYQEWVTQWWSVRKDFFSPLVLEERLVRPLGTLPNGRGVWVHGTPDVIEQSGLTDWKTAGRGWSPGKGETRIQSPTYLWLAEEIRYTLPGLADYVVYDRQKKRWSSHPYQISEANINAALNVLWEFSCMIDAQVFPPTPAAAAGRPGRGWWCTPKYCNAWDLCEFKALVADDLDVLQIRSKRWE